jgi:hypothetical protein
VSSDAAVIKLTKAIENHTRAMQSFTRICIAMNTNLTQLGQLLEEKTDVDPVGTSVEDH